MKQKKPGKKLNLNKKTIAGLENRQISAVYGGDPVPLETLVFQRTCCTCGEYCIHCVTGGLHSCSDVTYPCPTGILAC
jgi:natural product precursor